MDNNKDTKEEVNFTREEVNCMKKRIKKSIKKIGFLLVIFLILIPLILTSIIKSFLALGKEFQDSTKIVSSQIDIYSLKNDETAFCIIKKENFDILALKNKSYYYMQIDEGDGKHEESYDVRYVLIKDDLESGQQAYAKIDEKVTPRGAILSTKITLYIPKGYKIINE